MKILVIITAVLLTKFSCLAQANKPSPNVIPLPDKFYRGADGVYYDVLPEGFHLEDNPSKISDGKGGWYSAGEWQRIQEERKAVEEERRREQTAVLIFFLLGLGSLGLLGWTAIHRSRRDLILTAAGLSLVAILIYPPWQLKDRSGHLRGNAYAVLWEPPTHLPDSTTKLAAILDVPRLLTSVTIVAVIGGAALCLTRKKQP